MKRFYLIILLLLLPLSVFAGRILPDPKLTPGFANPDITPNNIDQNICKHGWSTKSIRPPTSYTNKLKRHQIKQYGYADKNMADFEEDHLIALTIGGNPTDPRNLWPESYAGKWGARTKDKLEVKLNKLVCSHQLPLRQAQDCIAKNWVVCYRKYMGKP